MAYVNKERKLAELSQIARKKEGKCLSTEYVDSISYLIFLNFTLEQL